MRLQTSGREVVCDLGELHAVGGHRDVDAERRQHLDQAGEVRPDQRLAAGDPHRLEAVALHAHPHDPGLLLIREQLVAGQPLHALLGHAVGAAEIAAVGDRDPEVGDPAPEAVDEGAGPSARTALRTGARWPRGGLSGVDTAPIVRATSGTLRGRRIANSSRSVL